MDIASLYHEIISMYPSKINLTGTKLHDNGGATIPQLIEAHDKISEIVIEKSEQHEAMDWAIFQTLHKVAKDLVQSNNLELEPTTITYQAVQPRYKENMQSIIENRRSNAT